MCIAVFLWQSHPLYLLLLNRDEYHSRAVESLGWWDGGEILGGRDGLAGGTWLASGRDGRLAFVASISQEQRRSPSSFLREPKEPSRVCRGNCVGGRSVQWIQPDFS